MHCYNFPETSLPAGNDCAGSVLLKYTVDFRNTEGKKKKKRFFLKSWSRPLWFFFLLPRRSSVEKGTATFLRFSLWDGAKRDGAQEPPAETWASGRSVNEPFWACLEGVWALKGRAGGKTKGPFPPESQIRWYVTVGGRLWQVFISPAVLGRSGMPGKAAPPTAMRPLQCWHLFCLFPQ